MCQIFDGIASANNHERDAMECKNIAFGAELVPSQPAREGHLNMRNAFLPIQQSKHISSIMYTRRQCVVVELIVEYWNRNLVYPFHMVLTKSRYERKQWRYFISQCRLA